MSSERRGAGRRGRGRPKRPAAERKDRLIQTRVDGDLEETLREAARRQRMTVSQLIRNLLEDTYHVVDGVVADARHLAQVVSRDARAVASAARGRRDPLGDVEAWQEVVMGRLQSCARCGAALARGDKGFMGLSDQPGSPRLWLCVLCGASL
ncbi:MAG TPA: hypothetical protein VL172_07260 [Kofleriaceae bacterium]|jgi:hypothetical protein|nr:hypothetical protein [Kofleriaceae bacterium]